MSAASKCDVVVLGLGVGGEEVAGRLAEAGLSVVGIEGRLVGGECPYYGCIPSKMMIRAANLLAEARRIPGMAGAAQATPDWGPVHARLRDEATDDWNDRVAVERLVRKGVRFVRGWGRIVAPGRVAVGDEEFEAARGVVVGTGTKAVIPPIEGLRDTPLWTNKEAIEAAALPDSLVVLGGGAIGLELAQAFARFGVQVTVIEALDRLLALEEPEASKLVTEALAVDGVQVFTGAPAKQVSYVDGRFHVMLDDVGVEADRLLVATGRRPDLSAIGLDSLSVDERMRAGEKLWAVGDVTGRGAFTHVAMYQAGIVIRDILGQDGPAADYRALPRVTFTDPEIASVGMTEAQARKALPNVQTGQSNDSTRVWIHRGEELIKVVADADRGVLVGATAAGPAGGEVLSALTVAIHGEVPIERLIHMMYAYPTFHRGIQTALKSLA
ncbi:dihydrolipoyl dehydrogenase family protein [Allorhizocola rhizosphaerae]|uniref:dihydrolipoyl dehydrogenase family protein n=1 Tax=Allorhizocola rhizosphaerae TaxID=1872709 RepID=UPI000E3C347B|nr:NAD(P)/FAD-dependent oxidoreductase [Allorhizocola rhizosphaerae]